MISNNKQDLSDFNKGNSIITTLKTTNSINEYHYLCPKCKIFPFIEFCKDKKYIKCACSCINNEKLLIEEFIKKIQNNKTKEYICLKHNLIFEGFSKLFQKNICKKCIEESDYKIKEKRYNNSIQRH